MTNEIADDLCQIGFEAYQSNDFYLAESYLLQALEKDENHLNSHFNLAHLYKIQEKFALAIIHFQKVLELDPQDKDSQNELKECKLALQNAKTIQTLETSNSTPAAFSKSDCTKIINKIADVQELHNLAKKSIINRLFLAKRLLIEKNPDYKTDFGEHWLRLWELSHLIIESEIDSRMDVLEINGANSLLSFYLATENCQVWTTSTDNETVNQARKIAQSFDLPIKISLQEMEKLVYENESFDRVFCVRGLGDLNKTQQKQAIIEMKRVLRKGGILGLIFDFGSRTAENNGIFDEEEFETFFEIEGFSLLGNKIFSTEVADLGGTSLSFTKGCVFLRKEGFTKLPPLRELSFGVFPALQNKNG